MSQENAEKPAAENRAVPSLPDRRTEIEEVTQDAIRNLAPELIAERMSAGESFDDAQEAVAGEMVEIFSQIATDAVMEMYPFDVD